MRRGYRIAGRVQGVGFRYFTRRVAQQIGVTGWVRNLPDGGVEAEVQGTAEQVTGFEAQIRRGPAGALVTGVEATPLPDQDDLAGRFERALGPEHSDTLWVKRNLALVRGKQGAYEEAAGLLQQALETARAARGPDDADAAAAFYDMGVLALLRGRRSEALDRLREAVAHGYDAALFPEDPDLEALHGDAGFEALVGQPPEQAPER